MGNFLKMSACKSSIQLNEYLRKLRRKPEASFTFLFHFLFDSCIQKTCKFFRLVLY